MLLVLIGLVAGATVLFSVRQHPATAPAAGAAKAPGAAARSKEQAMAALMALPELKAWSAHIEKTSNGKAHGALIEDAPEPAAIGGKSYWRLTFIENGADAAHRWESFLVASSGDEILVEDMNDDRQLTLAQWRSEKRPMERAAQQ